MKEGSGILSFILLINDVYESVIFTLFTHRVVAAFFIIINLL